MYDLFVDTRRLGVKTILNKIFSFILCIELKKTCFAMVIINRLVVPLKASGLELLVNSRWGLSLLNFKEFFCSLNCYKEKLEMCYLIQNKNDFIIDPFQ